MFAMAREQAKRDEEVGRLRMQLKSLRDMLRESHKVLKHLMQQESLLKAELHTARRDNQRADGLNVEYVKNVLRGRAAWGLKHRLTRKWAELPAQKRALTMAEAMPRVAKRAANNVRVPPLAEGAVGRSGPLFA